MTSVMRNATLADRTKRSGYAVMAIARLIEDNDMRATDGGDEFLNSFTLAGLATALNLIGADLFNAADNALELIEQEGKQ